MLTRIFGLSNIELIEDSIQEALLRALRNWPFNGIPENPTAWLIQVAKNHLYDHFKKTNRLDSFEQQLTETAELGEPRLAETFFASEIAEDELRMIFACCHPSIPKDAQVALTLKIVGGFNNREIARAFFAKTTAIDKMLVRAKARLGENRESFGIPPATELSKRLDAVLKVIYLMFNEGYMASEGEKLLRTDLCFEAIRLISLICLHPITNSPRANALAALLNFHASRLRARVGDDGVPTILADQDRSLWDRGLITKGFLHLRNAARGSEVSVYHLEAEIASYHAAAGTSEDTDWRGILRAYERLSERNGSALVAVNRIYALSHAVDVEAALLELRQYEEDFSDQHAFHLVAADLYERNGEAKNAITHLKAAVKLISNRSVSKLAENKIARLDS